MSLQYDHAVHFMMNWISWTCVFLIKGIWYCVTSANNWARAQSFTPISNHWPLHQWVRRGELGMQSRVRSRYPFENSNSLTMWTVRTPFHFLNLVEQVCVMFVYNVTINIILVIFYTCIIIITVYGSEVYTQSRSTVIKTATTGWKDSVTTNCIIKLCTYHRSSVVPPTLAKLAGWGIFLAISSRGLVPLLLSSAQSFLADILLLQTN